jgi:HSP20 family protein
MTYDQNVDVQGIPANVYRTAERVMIAAPMPGLEPEDIAVDIDESGHVVLHGDLRGALKGEKDILQDEWTPGPYHRELQLPAEVDGERANVTYSNGVLVAVLPVTDRTRPAHLTLEQVGSARGEHVGHTGRIGDHAANEGNAGHAAGGL